MGMQPIRRTKQNKFSLLGNEIYSHVKKSSCSVLQIDCIPTDMQGVYCTCLCCYSNSGHYRHCLKLMIKFDSHVISLNIQLLYISYHLICVTSSVKCKTEDNPNTLDAGTWPTLANMATVTAFVWSQVKYHVHPLFQDQMWRNLRHGKRKLLENSHSPMRPGGLFF